MREDLNLKHLSIDLSSAIYYDDLPGAIGAINRGADINRKSSNGSTPAIEACETGALNVLDLLIYYGADLSIQNEAGESVLSIIENKIKTTEDVEKKEAFVACLKKVQEALKNPQPKNPTPLWDLSTQGFLGDKLIEATQEGNLEKVKSLIKQGANVLHTNSEGRNALLVANYFGHEALSEYISEQINLSQSFIGAICDYDVERAKKMLKKGAHPMSYDQYGNLGIFLAAERGMFPLVKQMIQLGVDVNVSDKNYNSLMTYAIRQGETEVVDYLFEKGFNRLRHNKGRMQDMDRDAIASCNLYLIQKLITTKEAADRYMGDAIQTNSDHIMDYFFSLGAKEKANQPYDYPRIVSVIQTKNPHIVKRAIDNGLFIDKPNRYGQWALLEAVKTGSTEILGMLLDKKPVVDRSNKQGWTALMEACKLGNQQMAKMLIEAGADVNKQDHRGWTPLMVAAESGSYQTAGELYVAGADMNRQNNKGETALSIALDGQKVDIARHILFWGAKESIQLPSGKELLFRAIDTQNKSLINELVVNGAKVNGLDRNDDLTPLTYAMQKGNVDFVSYFLEKGADPLLKNKYTTTAYYYGQIIYHNARSKGLDLSKIKLMQDMIMNAIQKRKTALQVIQKAKPIVSPEKGEGHVLE